MRLTHFCIAQDSTFTWFRTTLQMSINKSNIIIQIFATCSLIFAKVAYCSSRPSQKFVGIAWIHQDNCRRPMNFLPQNWRCLRKLAIWGKGTSENIIDYTLEIWGLPSNLRKLYPSSRVHRWTVTKRPAVTLVFPCASGSCPSLTLSRVWLLVIVSHMSYHSYVMN